MSSDRPDAPSIPSRPSVGRAAYTAPCLVPLGAWRALTLQQSIPIGPGNAGLAPFGPPSAWLA